MKDSVLMGFCWAFLFSFVSIKKYSVRIKIKKSKLCCSHEWTAQLYATVMEQFLRSGFSWYRIRKLLDYVKLHRSENALKIKNKLPTHTPQLLPPPQKNQTQNNTSVSFQVFLSLRVQLPTHAKK